MVVHKEIIHLLQGASGGVMVNKLGEPTFTRELKSNWVPHLYCLVPQKLSELQKIHLLLEFLRQLKAGERPLSASSFTTEYPIFF